MPLNGKVIVAAGVDPEFAAARALVALGYKGAASFRHEGAAHAGLTFKDIEKAAQYRVLETRAVGPVFVKYKPMSEEAKEKLRRRKTRERVGSD